MRHKHYAAYQTWANPSWQGGPRFGRRYYGCGDTAEEARFHATHFRRNGQWWSHGPGSGHPNTSDLSVQCVSRTDCPVCGSGPE